MRLILSRKQCPSFHSDSFSKVDAPLRRETGQNRELQIFIVICLDKTSENPLIFNGL